MLRNFNELIGRTIEATDGDIGTVAGCYFSPARWQVTYLVAATGTWLMSRDVLVPPSFFSPPEPGSPRFAASLTRDQVRDSPPVDFGRSLSEEQAIDLGRYFSWPMPWDATSELPPGDARSPAVRRPVSVAEKEVAERLLSSRQIRDFDVMAQDGKAGSISDFVIDDASWEIRYLVLDIGGLLHGTQVLLVPLWVATADEQQALLQVDLSRDRIRHSPAYDPAVPLTRTDEDRLYDYYGLAKETRRY